MKMILLNNETYKRTMFCTDQDELHMIMESLMDLAEENADNDLYITEIYKAVLNLLNNECRKTFYTLSVHSLLFYMMH